MRSAGPSKRPIQSRWTDNWLLDLPTEVRHSIYRYLLCEISHPIWITSHYKLWPSFKTSEADPIFQTQLFRVSQKVHDDAVRFAYGFNAFEVRDDFTAFCHLGQKALSCIRKLTVVQGAWRAETEWEDRAWSVISAHCASLETFDVVLHADMLIPAIPFLLHYSSTNQKEGPIPKIAVDLHVWDRHFSFDTENRDYVRAKQLLTGTHIHGPNSPRFISPQWRITRLPRRASEIVLTADVTSGTIRALDDYLEFLDAPFLVKSARTVPEKGYRAAGGRSQRCWYDFNKPVQ